MAGAAIDIGQVIRKAVVFNPKYATEHPVNEPALLRSVEQLFELLDERRIDYVLVGGIALLQYVEGRNTEDIDLIVAVSVLRKLPEIQLGEQSDYFAQGELGDLKIDFLLTRNRLFQYVQRHLTATREFAGRTVRCATVEGLILLKLYALPGLYRQGNFARISLYENDLATLIQSYKPDLARLFTILAKHLNATDLSGLQEIVGEIEQRIERFHKGL
jgi:hypothetical protein